MNIFNSIKQETQSFSGKTALIEGDIELSYGELISRAEAFTAVLAESGIGQFHRVGFLCGDGIDYIIVSLALLSLSSVVVPISVEQTADEIESIINTMALDFLIFERGVYHHQDSQSLQTNGLHKKELHVLRRRAGGALNKKYYEINPAFIRFSSGTTGKSKGIVLSHETIIERTDAANNGLTISPADTVLWVLSMHFHFVVTILLFLRRAATIVLCDNLFPDSMIQAITTHKVTFLYASPFHYSLLNHSESLSRESLKTVRLAVSTAMKLPERTARTFYEKSGKELAEAFGIMEVGLPLINLSGKSSARGTVGMPLPDYEIKIADPEEDGVGEIYIKGKGMLDAYFSPWQDRNSILENGWFKTGDLGKIDSLGYLTVVGRGKNIINFAGMKVFPYEVESVLNQHPYIRESLVYGVDHTQYGQLPIAKVVLNRDVKKTPDLDNLRRFCYERLSPYKVPKNFEFVSSIPKTASGKLRR